MVLGEGLGEGPPPRAQREEAKGSRRDEGKGGAMQAYKGEAKTCRVGERVGVRRVGGTHITMQHLLFASTCSGGSAAVLPSSKTRGCSIRWRVMVKSFVWRL
eukprot:EG_transcript_30440